VTASTGTAVQVRTVRAACRAQWRAWLEEHCGTVTEVWLVIHHKHSATPSITHREAIEEALCFGWIDSHTRKHDTGSWRQRFTPRGPRSAWSKVNRELVEQLSAAGLMTPRGQAAVDLAKRAGTWGLLADAQSGVIPDDLRELLAADPVAARNFDAFTWSVKRAALERIARAVRPDTRRRRVVETVECAARNTWP
jgi:uncharacterized protein YdeI (YjbR/CyaY-like superfamily)